MKVLSAHCVPQIFYFFFGQHISLVVKHIVNVLFWKWWGRNWENNISWVKCKVQEWSSVSIHCQPPWSHNSSSSEIKFTCPFQSSSTSLCLRQQLSHHLNHKSLIQSESGVNRLFSLAVWGNCSHRAHAFFQFSLFLFPHWISSSYFGFLLHCISLRLKGCWGPSLFPPEQTAGGPSPAQHTALLRESGCTPNTF